MMMPKKTVLAVGALLFLLAPAAVAMPTLQDEWRFFCAANGGNAKLLAKAKQRVDAGGDGAQVGGAMLNYACVTSALEKKRFEALLQKFNDQGAKGTAPALDNRRSAALVKAAAQQLGGVYKENATNPKTLYSLAMALALQGNDLAVNRFDEVMRLHPKSAFAASSALAMADYFYETKGAAAAKPYYKTALKDGKGSIAPYTRYKLGWIAYVEAAQAKNRAGQKQAITRLAQLSKQLAAAKGRSRALSRLVKADILTLVVDYGDQSEAQRILSSVGAADVYATFLERLAFAKLAANDAVNAYKLFELAWKEQPTGPNSLQLRVNMAALAAQLVNVPLLAYNVKMLVKNYVDPKAVWRKKRKPAELKAAEAQIEGLAFDYAVAVDQQGRSDNKPAYLTTAEGLYQLFMKTFPKSAKTYDLKFSYGQLQYVMKKYRESAQTLGTVVTLNPKGPHTKDALELMVTAAQYAVDTDKTDYKLPKPGAARKPLKIPENKKTYADSLDMFVKYMPQDQNAAAMRYAAASVYYDFGHYKDGLRRYFSYLRTDTASPFAVTAAARILEYYKNQKNEKRYEKAKAKIAAIGAFGSAPELAPYYAKPAAKPAKAKLEKPEQDVATDPDAASETVAAPAESPAENAADAENTETENGDAEENGEENSED
jgi:TolA-binding protein